MAENVISKVETDFRQSLTLAFVDGNCVANAQGKLSAMECDSFGPDFNFEKDSWYFNEGGTWSYNFNVNNAWGHSSHNAFFTVNDAGVKVDVAHEHDDAANFEAQVVWRDSRDVDSL